MSQSNTDQLSQLLHDPSLWGQHPWPAPGAVPENISTGGVQMSNAQTLPQARKHKQDLAIREPRIIPKGEAALPVLQLEFSCS